MAMYNKAPTRKFTEIYAGAEDFLAGMNSTGLNVISEDNTKKLYYLIIGHFGDCHIMQSSESGFEYACASIIFRRGRQWERSLKMQEEISVIDIKDVMKTGEYIHNTSVSPNSDQSSPDAVLNYIDSQNRSYQSGNILDAYNKILTSLDDVTIDFIEEFRPLFNMFGYSKGPMYDSIYNEEEEDE